MAEAGTVSVGIEPLMDGFKEAVSGGILSSVSQVGDSAGDLLGKAITAAVPFAAALGATDAIKSSVDATSEYGETLEKVSMITGESANQSARLLAGFGGAGISADQATPMIQRLETSLGRMANSAANAGAGGNTASRTFAELGVSLTDAHGKAIPMTTLMPEIIDKLNGIQDPAQRAAIASQLFGRNYGALAPLLAKGGEGFREAEGDAEKYGLTIGEDGVEKTAKYHEAQQQLSEAVLGLQVNLGERLIPAFTTLIGTVANVVGAFNTMSGPFRILSPFVPVILGIVAAIAAWNAIAIVHGAIEAAQQTIRGAQISFMLLYQMLTGETSAADTVAAASHLEVAGATQVQTAATIAAAFAEYAWLGPALIIIAVLAALVIGILLVVKHWQLVHSWLTDVWNLMQAAAAWIAGVFVTLWTTLSTAVQNFLTALGNVMAAVPGVVTSALGAALSRVVAWVGSMVAEAVSAGANFLNGVRNGLAAIPGVVAGALGAALGAVFSWGSSMAGAARSAAYNAAAAVPGAFSALPGEMVSIGAQIISGMISGIQSAVGGLASAAASAAGSALNAAKSALGISSPSRVMAEEVGGPMAEGMVQGFQNGVTSGLKGVQIPTPQMPGIAAGAAAGGGGPVVAINNPTFKDEADVEVLMRKVEAAVSAQKF